MDHWFSKRCVAKFSNNIKCASLNNQPCQSRTTLINLNPEELHYYQFVVSGNKCDGSCNTIDDSFDRICVLNKIVKRCKPKSI